MPSSRLSVSRNEMLVVEGLRFLNLATDNQVKVNHRRVLRKYTKSQTNRVRRSFFTLNTCSAHQPVKLYVALRLHSFVLQRLGSHGKIINEYPGAPAFHGCRPTSECWKVRIDARRMVALQRPSLAPPHWHRSNGCTSDFQRAA